MTAATPTPTAPIERRRHERGRLGSAAFVLGLVLAYALGLWTVLIHVAQGHHERAELSMFLHWLRDSTLGLPGVVAAAWLALRLARRLAQSTRRTELGVTPTAMIVAACASVALALGGIVHGPLFGVHEELVAPAHIGWEALLIYPVALMSSALVLLALSLKRPRSAAAGVRWRAGSTGSRLTARSPRSRRLLAATLSVALFLAFLPTMVAPAERARAAGLECGAIAGTRTIVANVVALDQPFFYNRLGAFNPAGMIYALRRDVVVKGGSNAGLALTELPPEEAAAEAGNVELRPDKRPRPLVLRANVGDCLDIHFQNLLGATAADNEQPADRHAAIHVNGMQMVDPDGAGPQTAIESDGSFVGSNESSLAAPGETRTYKLYAEHENTYLLSNPGVVAGAEGDGGSTGFGLFGAVNIEPYGTEWYRSQITRDDMDLATTGETADGQPLVDYAARYPSDAGRESPGLPILNMLDGNEIVHSDLNAIISGPANTGYRIPDRSYPQSYWDNQIYNLLSKHGGQPFREFTVIFHDEIFAKQAFDQFNQPAFRHALHGVRDGFAINYGAAGAGAEIIGNRLGVGPMWDCADCKYEEFFLTSWAVGDPAMVVDIPANAKDGAGNVIPGPKATKALYPDDPSNVHHSYLNDRVKFRNLHAGPKEHHIFHLHAHQWQLSPNSEKSNYLDSQAIGPGGGFTYEIAYGGSGNRNKAPGDSIFHCHFYPHFAQGMWELWRVHDTFERGTPLDASGRPEPGSRALPDGEIAAGTPIPGVVPLPATPMAPMPSPETTIVGIDPDNDGAGSSQLDIDGDGSADLVGGFAADPARNPGYPFFVPGIAGHRPPTAPLDLVDADGNGQVEDGGLPRHVITGGTAEHFETRLDFDKILERATVAYLPENGTPAERLSMDFHARQWHPTFLPDGSPVDAANPLSNNGGYPIKGFEANGLPPKPGAPWADPCRSDPNPVTGSVGPVGNPRTYKGAVLQFDLIMNKLGWHFPQERILALWRDVGPTLTGARAPEPLVMRLGVNDCAQYWHTNLVPNVYELDDYQVRTPTDVIGQHIHLVKFDVMSADGSGNGFNYEDGTFSPQEVEERIHAIRAENGCTGDARLNPGETWTRACPLARAHPFFRNVAGVGDLAWGARTTIQRWYADPVMNNAWDQGHGSVFTHDHFGPSTHQQTGVYSTVLVEPRGSVWRDPESGTPMGSRDDGGPTSWRADIYWPGADPRNENAHREYYLEFADFVHAYEAGGAQRTTVDNGAGVQIPTYADPANVISPSFRQQPPAGQESDLFFFPPVCPDGSPRPCPEAISADDIGTDAVNYRQEPLGLRVFDPATGTQATGPRGDLALAFQSRTDRAIPALNKQPGFYPALTKGIGPGDPFTPLLRAYMGDKIRIRAQVGATEEQHNIMVQGLKWRQEPLLMDSGWRNSQAGGISEYFNLETPVLPDVGPGSPAQVDYLYAMGAQVEDLWNGIWGILRSYGKGRKDLLKLPNNPIPDAGWKLTNEAQFNESCPLQTNGRPTPVRSFKVSAVRAADVLGPNGLVYNDRTTAVVGPMGAQQGAGPLIDPTALMYVSTSDVVLDATGNPVGLKPGTPVEPLVLRAAAGDCIKVELTNRLPATVPDLPGFNALPPIVHKNENVNGGIVTFNANDLTPSSLVGLHPQLVQYNARKSEGVPVGNSNPSLVSPGAKKTYTWYAGDLSWVRDGAGLKMIGRPVEFGAVNLMPADRIKGTNKGLVGALVVEPPGATWVTDPGTRTSGTVTFPDGAGGQARFREFVTVLQDDLNLRYGNGCTPTASNLQCAVPAVASEGGGVPEDSEDAGDKAINYGAEPLWFRLGIAPDTPLEAPNLRGNVDVHRVYSNGIVGGDPQTAVFTAQPQDSVRFRVVQAGGHNRGHVFTVHGHAWRREPYVNNSDRLGWTSHEDPTTLNSTPAGTMPGHNMVSWWTNSQEGISASSHFDFVLPRAGGSFGAEGDYLFRDFASFGNYQGMWGILRVRR